MSFRTGALVATLFVAAACTATKPTQFEAKKLAAAQRGLSCEALKPAMNENIARLSAAGGDPSTAAGLGGSAAGRAVGVPLLGQVVSAGARAANAEQERAVAEAQIRYDAQFDAYVEKGCEPEVAYGEPIP